MKNIIFSILAVLLLTACGASKSVVGGGSATTQEQQNSYVFVGRVSDNASNAKSLVASIDFTIGDGTNDISVGGKLRMKRDEVIRINLTALGLMEVGVLEFTPSYVLIIDRIHSEYVKASYSEVDFLAKNGLSFHSLQALFWNELFYPGEKKVTEQLLRNFITEPDNGGQSQKVSLNRDAMTFSWLATQKEARITAADVKYQSSQYGTTQLHWDYSNFKPLAGKAFPHTQSFNLFSTIIGKGKKASVTITMNKVEVGKDFDTQTTPSAKYKKVEAEDLMKKLLSM